LLDSAYDVDKMDYLLRDSHYCGVQYGTFDIRRLVSTLTLDDEDPGGELRLAVEEGGYHALEALVIARYFMFTQVYFHRVRRANDIILSEFIEELLNGEYGSPHYPQPERLDQYLGWDDSRILAAAVERSDGDSENNAWMITNRRHPKTAYETLPHPDRMEARTALRRLLPEVRRAFPGVRVWQDNATDHPERYKQDDIPIRFAGDPPTWKSFADTSAVLRGLQDIGQVRLYAFANREVLSEIHEFCRHVMA
jgi:HD superfamily phosphohydrolase